jgi:hypothetical protein
MSRNEKSAILFLAIFAFVMALSMPTWQGAGACARVFTTSGWSCK